MNFNIERFLQSNNIPIRYSGENTQKGNINICCPFCVQAGRGDTNFHMGIKLSTHEYGCWRNQTHRGHKIEKLVRVLLDCTYAEARKIVYGVELIEKEEAETWASRINKIFTKDKAGPSPETTPGPKELLFPSSFIEIKATGVTGRFYKYLASRGFDNVDSLIKNYSLFCCLNGEYADRIIFPVFLHGELVTWSTRSIDRYEWLRYRDLEVDKSVVHVKQLLYNYDTLLSGGRTLFITEGLFDCIKLDFYFEHGCRATCFSTKTMTENQRYQLINLSKVFDKIVIFLDNDAKSACLEISMLLRALPNVHYKFLPKGFKDPGDFTRQDVLNLEAEVLDGKSESGKVYT